MSARRPEKRKAGELDFDRLEVVWKEAVFALYLVEDKIEPEVVENMRSWEHHGFSVDQSVLLPAGDQAVIDRLVQYMTCCPFSLAQLVKVSRTGQVVYKAEKASCRSFPDPGGDGTQAGPKRNYQILSSLEFLADFTQHIPPKGVHLIHLYGWYTNKNRGTRKKTAAAAGESSAVAGRIGTTKSPRSGNRVRRAVARNSRWTVVSGYSSHE